VEVVVKVVLLLVYFSGLSRDLSHGFVVLAVVVEEYLPAMVAVLE
jgi:hypothetical protein